MKLHYGGTPEQAPQHAFAERGVAFASTADGRLAFRVGKKAAGRLLDGRTWDEQPGGSEAA
jgi:protein gp37